MELRFHFSREALKVAGHREGEIAVDMKRLTFVKWSFYYTYSNIVKGSLPTLFPGLTLLFKDVEND